MQPTHMERASGWSNAREWGAPYHGEQPVDGHGSLLSLHVGHVILDHLVRDAVRELVAQLDDPGEGEKQFGNQRLLCLKPVPWKVIRAGTEGKEKNSPEEVRTNRFAATANEETQRPAPLPTKTPLHLMEKRPQLFLTALLLHLTFSLFSTATHRAPPLPASPAPRSLSRAQMAGARPSAPALYVHGVGNLRLHLYLRHDGGLGCAGRWRHRGAARTRCRAADRGGALRWRHLRATVPVAEQRDA